MSAVDALPFPNGSGAFSAERKRAIIFGGAGFIGSHLLKSLAAGYPDAELYSVDTSVEPRFRVGGVHYVEHDVNEAIPRQLCGTGRARRSSTLPRSTPPLGTKIGNITTPMSWAPAMCAGMQRRLGRGASSSPARSRFTDRTRLRGTRILNSARERLRPLKNDGRGDPRALAGGARRERHLTIVRPAVIYGAGERGNFTRLANLLAKGRFVYPGRKDTIKSCGYVKDLVSSMLFMAAKPDRKTVYNFCYPERYTSEDICAAFSDAAGYGRPRMVAPIGLMLLGGLAFEVLSKLGIKTKINRARIEKLYHSTNIVPKRLQEASFRYGYTLRNFAERLAKQLANPQIHLDGRPNKLEAMSSARR